MTAEWRTALIKLSVVIAILLAVFHRDVADVASIWWTVSTYSHCLFILPIIGWLIWLRRDEIARFHPAVWLPGLVLLFLAGLIWLIGDAAGVSLLRHAGLVAMIQASVVTILGFQVARGLLFPLFYLVFLVPLGDELVAPMQTVTARLTMIFLHIAGIPAALDGVFITTPVGLFEVAEACSGVKFLVAMVAYGALAANVCFESWRRRAAFMIVAVVVPVIANGVRAYATIHVSERTGSTRFAESFDHIVFGWVFFALVMALVMAMGWRFFDRRFADPWLGDWARRPRHGGFAPTWRVVALALAAALLPMSWGAVTAASPPHAMGRQIALPDVPGWSRVQIVQTEPWRPRFDGADHYLSGQYRDPRGRRVDLVLALYAAQDRDRKVLGYAQGAFDPNGRWSWSGSAPPPPDGTAVRIVAPGVSRIVWSFYRLGGRTTGRTGMIKWQTLRGRLLGGDPAAAALLMSSEGREDAALLDFRRALGDPGLVADSAVAAARGG